MLGINSRGLRDSQERRWEAKEVPISPVALPARFPHWPNNPKTMDSAQLPLSLGSGEMPPSLAV